jgi:hypothetical protein
MASLKAKQEAKERGEWDEMPEKQRTELENAFRTAGRIARYTNIMGLKTVEKQRCARIVFRNFIL